MKRPSANLIVVLCVSAAVLAAVIVGAVLLDSPAQARLRRLDERRVEHLRELAYAIDAYWTAEDRLPSSLAELPDERGYLAELVDPETGGSYNYRVLGEDSYELCAVFASETSEQFETPFQDAWFHGPGRQCFELEAQDPERPIGR